MKRLIALIIIILTALNSCNDQEKEARLRLNNAKDMFQRNELSSAKSELDSVRILFPKQLTVLRESLSLMRLIEKTEAERTIAFCDSLIPIRQKETEELRKDFVFEKDSTYEKIGTYIFKQQTIERNVRRCYIRSGVNELGEMYIASVYFGSTPINHTSIKLSTKDGLFAETASIPYDGGVNYRFRDEGYTEIVNYKASFGEDVINFIYNNGKERIKVEYEGGKPFVIHIADGDKNAIIKTVDFSRVLSDIESMTQAKEKALRRLEYLNQKLKE